MKQLIISRIFPELLLPELRALNLDAQPFGSGAALTETDHLPIEAAAWQKAGIVLAEFDGANAGTIQNELEILVPSLAENDTENRPTVALSCYSRNISPHTTRRLSLEFKKVWKKCTRQAPRMIISRTGWATQEQLRKNEIHRGGIELLISTHKNKVVIARTDQLFNDDLYQKIDKQRPCRDPKVGMLPPRLAQIMLNLAQVKRNDTLLDPFCGSGTVLLLGSEKTTNLLGSDIDQAMVECSTRNVDWLVQEKPELRCKISLSDAKNSDWSGYNRVVTEGYLGPLFSNQPTEAEIERIKPEMQELYDQFLRHTANTLPEGGHICLSIPEWLCTSQKRLSLSVDHWEHLGYTFEDFGTTKRTFAYRHRHHTVGRLILTLRKQ